VNPGIPGLSLEERNLLSPGGIRTPHCSTRSLVTILTISRLPGYLEGEKMNGPNMFMQACRTCINTCEHWRKNVVNDIIRDTGGSRML
jgi:hypothetical protein